jgi:hypothetical protein
MTDNDHNAFVSMHSDIECENPFDEGLAWDWDEWDWDDDFSADGDW